MANYSFTGKHVLVTGATGGVGSAISQKLAGVGASLVVSSRSENALQELIATFPEETRAVAETADLAQPGEAEKLAQKAIKALGHIDTVFNIAGVGYFALMEETTAENIRHLFELNVFSPLALIKALMPHMKARGSGRIINIVSCAGRVPIPTEGVYGGSKTALAVMANTMRLEIAPSGIGILNIYPGTVDSEFERNALRENERPGVCPRETCGLPRFDMAEKILTAAAGPPGEAWLEREGKWMAAAAIMWPGYVDRRLEPLRDKVVSPVGTQKPAEKRKWHLWQVESAIACNLKCVMCPWTEHRRKIKDSAIMDRAVWNSLQPYLSDVRSIDFTGGGEPLLQPLLADWIGEAKTAGCETGVLTNGMLLSPDKAKQLLNAGIDWVCFSMDGATDSVYEEIRKGANFKRLCDHIRGIARIRIGKQPLIMINYVIMTLNAHQLEDIVRLAAELGVDQINFKQCDVIRGEHGKGLGLFQNKRTREVRKVEKALSRAKRLARKLKINTTSFSLTPEEQPVCDQDPRNSLFIRHDGAVSPCINLAIGGPTTFLDQEVTMPTVRYGRLPESDLASIWNGDTCNFYRGRFEERVDAHDTQLGKSDLSEPSLIKLKEALRAAIEAMPEAPEGCRVCHYLYDI